MTDWQYELANSFKKPIELLNYLEIDPKGYDFSATRLFPMLIPQHFVSLMKKRDPFDPLLLQVLPLEKEFYNSVEYSEDPLQEQQGAIPGLLHKYKSRILLILKTGCAVNCRYCFRRHFPYKDNKISKKDFIYIIDYIMAHPEINEVILSGGDPLMATDDYLTQIFANLNTLTQIKRIRIHTRLPVVLPNRLSSSLIHLLQNNPKPIIIVFHINHPNELCTIFYNKIKQLQHSNITLLNQSVLLKDINDNIVVLSKLSEKLFNYHILPYYLHVLDKVKGATHFDIETDKIYQLQQQLLAELPGFLVPKIVKEEANQASKTPI